LHRKERTAHSSKYQQTRGTNPGDVPLPAGTDATHKGSTRQHLRHKRFRQARVGRNPARKKKKISHKKPECKQKEKANEGHMVTERF